MVLAAGLTAATMTGCTTMNEYTQNVFPDSQGNEIQLDENSSPEERLQKAMQVYDIDNIHYIERQLPGEYLARKQDMGTIRIITELKQGNLDVYRTEEGGLRAEGTFGFANRSAMRDVLEDLDEYGDGIMRTDILRDAASETMSEVYRESNN